MSNLISLGSGCDAALHIKRLKLNQNTGFFDYLWNYNDGIKSVIKIIDSDFEGFDSISNYRYDRILAIHGGKQDIVINKNYENIGFIHYDIFGDPKVLESFKRKILRIKQKLYSDEMINFVYYRSYKHTIESDYKKYPDFNIPVKIDYLVSESKNFVRYFSNKFPNKKFKLHSFFEEPVDNNFYPKHKIKSFLSNVNCPNNLRFDSICERFNSNISHEDCIMDEWEEKTNKSWEIALKKI